MAKTTTATKTKTAAKTASTVESLKSISATEFDKASEELAGKERTAQLQLASKKIEGVLLKGAEVDVKNAALADRVSHAENVRGVQVQTMAEKLAQENNVLAFATKETALKLEGLNIQTQGLEAHNAFGREMLATSQDMYQAKLAAAKANVQNFIASAQSNAAQLAGDVIDV
jgi:hypothetical protein